MVSLEGKVGIVTGASSGIGHATALAMAQQGVRVVAAARRQQRLDQLVEQIQTDGSDALAVPCDVTDWSQVEALIQTALRKYGTIDILVANAGVGIVGPLVHGNPADWKLALETNILSVLYSIKAAVPPMLEKGSGDVVILSSIAGRWAGSPFGVYAATKHAMTAIGKTLRQEVGKQGVRVALVEPGGVSTEFIQSSIYNLAPGQTSPFDGVPFTRLEPADIARAVVYIVQQPANVSVNEITIKPTQQV